MLKLAYMKCPRCEEPVEKGAAFCGNCGQPLAATTESAAKNRVSAQTTDDGVPLPPAKKPSLPDNSEGHAGLPDYAVAQPGQPKPKLTLARVFATLSVPAALLPLLGLVLSCTALVLVRREKPQGPRIPVYKTTTALAIAGLVLSFCAAAYNIHYGGLEP